MVESDVAAVIAFMFRFLIVFGCAYGLGFTVLKSREFLDTRRQKKRQEAS